MALNEKGIKIKRALMVFLFAFMLSASASAKDEKKPDGKVAKSPEEINPLKVGAKAPKTSLKTGDGKAFDLNAALAKQPTVLIFYRGRW